MMEEMNEFFLDGVEIITGNRPDTLIIPHVFEAFEVYKNGGKISLTAVFDSLGGYRLESHTLRVSPPGREKENK